MLLIICLMLAGILLGIFVFSRHESEKALKAAGRIQQLATVVLLFMMGLWLGGNTEFWANLKITGLHGFLFAAATITGSVIAVYFIARLLFRTPTPAALNGADREERT